MLRTAFSPAIRQALEAPDVIEVLVNPDGRLWLERHGIGLTLTDTVLSPEDRERVIRIVASSLGQGNRLQSSIVSAELPETGERFEGLLPPIATAPCFAIRKPSSRPFTLSDYVAAGTLPSALAAALRAAIETRANILIAGGTSSGKTTLANALLAEPGFADDRIILLEDTRELRVTGPDHVALRTHRDRADLKTLVRSTLRLRPDRIIVGEVRGPEALDLLKAWNTGHPGGLTTLHANSAHGALTRLEQLIGEATQTIPRALIAEAIDVVVFLSRAGGTRRVEDAIRITGFNGETYTTEPLAARKFSIVQQGALQ
ncbi:P-type conjugative transfer ATPase TrbB [Henriciella sp.]|uniref:P-type conjugative transfer ATPase TrbB n=1 Tax=Henriciella sp. TaxID=1968823 RepID=UPI003C71246A